MSQQQNTYVIVGVKFDYSKVSAKQRRALQPFTDKPGEPLKTYKGLCVLLDDLGGKYVIAGIPLAKSEEGQGLGQVVDCLPIASTVPEAHKLVHGELGEHLPKFGEFSIWVVTHTR